MIVIFNKLEKTLDPLDHSSVMQHFKKFNWDEIKHLFAKRSSTRVMSESKFGFRLKAPG
jgi:hypothetical protein